MHQRVSTAEIEFYTILPSFIHSSYFLGTTKATFEHAAINQSLTKGSNQNTPKCFKYIHLSRAGLPTPFLLLLCCFSVEHPLHTTELDARSTEHLLQQQVGNHHLNKQQNPQLCFINQELDKQKLFFHMLLQLRQPTLPSRITKMTKYSYNFGFPLGWLLPCSAQGLSALDEGVHSLSCVFSVGQKQAVPSSLQDIESVLLATYTGTEMDTTVLDKSTEP